MRTKVRADTACLEMDLNHRHHPLQGRATTN